MKILSDFVKGSLFVVALVVVVLMLFGPAMLALGTRNLFLFLLYIPVGGIAYAFDGWANQNVKNWR